MRFEQQRISVSALMSCALLAGCGGGSHGSTLSPPAQVSSTAPAPPYIGPLADATFKITIPVPTTKGKARRPTYVSSSTTKIVFTLNTDTVGLTGAALATFNAANLGAKAVTLNSATCPGTGPWTCTLTIKLPPGTDNITMSAQDSSNNVLSQQVQSFTVVAGIVNSFSTTLDANAATITVTGTQACQIGTVGSVYGSVGTSPVNFTVSYTDLATKTIVAPGLPVLTIQANHAGDTAFHNDSSTIDGTGGNVSFTINQAAQTFQLTPSTSSITALTVNIKATPASGTDGLSFNVTKSFTFSTGVAPPAHNFLAAVEQLTLASGRVDFFNVTLGGNTANSDTFAAFSPATLAVTDSSNQPGIKDVDNPLNLVWDLNGDLLIGNGGGAPGDNGNMACIPVGAISTGANTSTTVTANVDDPVGIAYDGRDGSVALSNGPASAPIQLAEYLLTGDYTAAPANRNLHVAGLGSLGGSVVNLPTFAAGTFAIALNDGCEVDAAHGGGVGCAPSGTSKIAILSPTGVETDITPSSTGTYCGQPASPIGPCSLPTPDAIDEPWGLAWDAQNNQLVIANNSTWHRLLSFYTITAGPTAVQTTVINTGHRNNLVAASADGHVAVAWVTVFGDEQVQVYGNTALRTPTGGPIPYNGVSAGCGGATPTYIYGNGAAIVNGLTWLSNTKLMVAVQSNNSGTPTALNGIYIYDITNLTVPAGLDDITCSAFAAAPTNTGFQHISNKPLGLAFKP